MECAHFVVIRGMNLGRRGGEKLVLCFCFLVFHFCDIKNLTNCFFEKRRNKSSRIYTRKKKKEKPKLYPSLVFLGPKTHKVFGKNNI
jgi:hypothetical protein